MIKSRIPAKYKTLFWSLPMMRDTISTIAIILFSWLFPGSAALALDTVNLAIPTKSFQHVIYPIAQDQRFFEAEGIDARIILVAPATSIQALMTKQVHFTLSGTSALIARSRSGAPLKVVLAANKQVLQWLVSRPSITSIAQLKNKRIAVPGIASSSTFITKQALPRYNLDPNKDVVFIDPGAGNHLPALLSGAVDAAILGAEQRYSALSAGMQEQLFLGNEVKNSWGTLATFERILQEDANLLYRFFKGTLKALRQIRANRQIATTAIMKFSRVDAALAGRVYDDLIGTFTTDGTVDDETQKNDLSIIQQIIGGTEQLPTNRFYDFALARKADRELTQTGWKP
jgi:ABC-type nitrate/sulfonate/bicarbonate transport system substrate-binding protein